MRQIGWRLLAFVLPIVGAAALLGRTSPLLVVAVAAALVATVGPSLWARIAPAGRRRLTRASNVAFLVFFSLYVVAAVVFLMAGLAPALARAFPALHRELHRLGPGQPASVQLLAQDNAFDADRLELPSGEVSLRFTNLDVGVPHNVSVSRPDEPAALSGDIIRGPASTTYEFDLPSGTYRFQCDVHPSMNGVVVAAPGPSSRIGPSGPIAGLAQRIALASHGSGRGADATGQRVVSFPQVGVSYAFSAINVILAVLLIWLRPRDRTARLLALGMVGTAAVFNAQAHVAFDVIPGAATDLAHETFHFVSGTAYLFGLLLFPDGRLVPRFSGPGWLRRPARAAIATAFAFAGLAFALNFHGADASGYVAFFGVLVPVAGVVSQAFRYRRAQGEEQRRQSRILMWALILAFGATILFIGLTVVVNAIRDVPRPTDLHRTVFLVFPVLFVLIPLTLVVVLVRYRLWDVQRVLNKTLVYALLAAFVSVVYVTIVVGIGSAIGVGGGGGGSLGLSILATALVAMAFEPLRARLQRLANVLVYGHRATPYEILTDFSKRIAMSLSVEEVLPRLAEAAAKGVGGARAKVRVFLPAGAVQAVTWPAGDADGEFDRTVTVHHHGDRVGDIRVAKAHQEALTAAEEELLNDLASQAGPALRNVQLTAELRGRLEEISAQAAELRASRQRLVTAQDAAARRLERNLHDGAQQQLVGIAVTAKLAREMAVRDPARSEELLVRLQETAQEALESIRDLAHGIYPPLLADGGLVVALGAQVRKASIPVVLEAVDVGRYPPETEAAVYFCTLEALQNVSKYAKASSVVVRLEGSDGWLTFSIADDGCGFDREGTPPGAGLQNMLDRLAALGGGLDISSAPGKGTVIGGRVPAAVEVVLDSGKG